MADINPIGRVGGGGSVSSFSPARGLFDSGKLPLPPFLKKGPGRISASEADGEKHCTAPSAPGMDPGFQPTAFQVGDPATPSWVSPFQLDRVYRFPIPLLALADFFLSLVVCFYPLPVLCVSTPHAQAPRRVLRDVTCRKRVECAGEGGGGCFPQGFVRGGPWPGPTAERQGVSPGTLLGPHATTGAPPALPAVGALPPDTLALCTSVRSRASARCN